MNNTVSSNECLGNEDSDGEDWEHNKYEHETQKINQFQLNDLIRDLGLSKLDAEIIASRLKQ